MATQRPKVYHRSQLYPARKTFAMLKIARISQGKHQRAWEQEIRREHNSNPLQRHSCTFYAGSFPQPIPIAIFTGGVMTDPYMHFRMCGNTV